tara:strand:+ start:284 stop:586 length:303 start_codon:yes stop_codon:yes gene_type:complete
VAVKTPLEKLQDEFGIELNGISKTDSSVTDLTRALYILNGVTEDDLDLGDDFVNIPQRGEEGDDDYRARVDQASVIANAQAPYAAMAKLLFYLMGFTDAK